MLHGWRGLGAFWLAVLLLLGGGAAWLQMLGPPAPPLHVEAARARPQVAAAAVAATASTAASAATASTAAPAPIPPPLVTERRETSSADRPGRDTPGPVADPDPALLEPTPGAPSDMLPRIAEDGRRPMQAYAAGFDRSSRRPRIGILLAGIGLNQEDSAKAIADLPGGITLAVSPYATRLSQLLSSARLGGHEYLLSVPMEPQGFPANDPGPRALMTGLSPAENLDRLRWLLARVGGYVGVTNGLGSLRGERLAGVAAQMDPILAELARRGLLYVDARPAGAGGVAVEPLVWSRDVDLLVDQPIDDIDVKLAQLEQIAHDRGDALGLAGAPSPVVVRHLAAWANGLLDRGLALAPVSALVRPPSDVSVSAQ
jgi:polysaccharide deacetylase 2 family uncharacterized protein YibQ